MMASRYAHAKQFKRHHRQLRLLRSRLGRIICDIRRKFTGRPEFEAVFEAPIARAAQIRSATAAPARMEALFRPRPPRSNASSMKGCGSPGCQRAEVHPGQKRKCPGSRCTPVLPSKCDMPAQAGHVCFTPHERTSSARSVASEKWTTRVSRPISTTTDCVACRANHTIGRSSPLPKNISVFTPPKSVLELFPSQPTRGAYHDRHETRGGVRWTRQCQARNVMQGRSKDL
jgi:hypothetical protein